MSRKSNAFDEMMMCDPASASDEKYVLPVVRKKKREESVHFSHLNPKNMCFLITHHVVSTNLYLN